MTTQSFDPLAGPLDGRNLIEASAGTGKTFTISRIFLRLILEKELTVDQILVVTFTEAATNELKERIHATLLDAYQALLDDDSREPLISRYIAGLPSRENSFALVRRALHNFDEAAILTIHRFCNRVLQDAAFESGSLFDTELVTEQTSLVRQIVEDFWRMHFYQASGLFLKYAIDKVDPNTFFRLLGNRLGRQDLRVLPEQVSGDTVDEEASFLTTYQAVRQMWEAQKADVMHKLSDGALYQSVYSEAQRATLMKRMDIYLASSDCNPAVFEDFDKFTISKIRQKTYKGKAAPAHAFFELCDSHLENYYRLEAGYEDKLMHIKSTLFDFVRQELKKRKQQQNVFYFDDLLLNLHAALAEDSGLLAESVRKKYRAALIDEFQDTDPVQYEIFHALFDYPGHALFLIGDPKQAIYGFRGADIFAYMRAKAETATENHYTLYRNYRSDPDLVRAFNAIFTNIDNAFLYEAIPFHPAEAAEERPLVPLIADGEKLAPFRLWFWDPEEHPVNDRKANREATVTAIVEAVASEIVRLLELGRKGEAKIGSEALAERDIAVLVRANAEARQMQQALYVRGINSVLYSSDNLFAAAEAMEMERILSGIAEPGRTDRLKAALATEIIGISGDELMRYAEDDSALEEWFYRFSEYHDLWLEHGFIRMFRDFFSRENLMPRLISLKDGERRITNLLHLSEILNHAASTQRLSISGLIKWLSEQRNNIDRSIEEHQIRLESDDNAIKLVTMHMSKGLEYPVVFCPFTWGGSTAWKTTDVLEFHDPGQQNAFTIDLGSQHWDEHRKLAEKEKLAENLRLLYVAVTRAKNCCYLVWGPFSGAGTSALAYLLHRSLPFDEDDPVAALKALDRNFDGNYYRATARRLAENSDGAITFQEMPELSDRVLAKTEESTQLAFEEFSGKIERAARISSYTSLVARHAYNEDLADHDVISFNVAPAAEMMEIGPDYEHFLHFPRGPKTGLFVHDLFQNLDYQALRTPETDAYVRTKLADYGFAPDWQQTTRKMLEQVLGRKLTVESGTFSLSEIASEQRLNEVEFYFPVPATLTPAALQQAFAGNGQVTFPPGFSARIDSLSFSPFHGFIKGFIDLIFEHEGRYYIVDWKSNFLGLSQADYHLPAVTKAMADNYYVLQYHIYTLALHKYLQVRLPDYRYDAHFGGVFYLFLRGMDDSTTNSSGIFFDRPNYDLITRLATALGESG